MQPMLIVLSLLVSEDKFFAHSLKSLRRPVLPPKPHTSSFTYFSVFPSFFHRTTITNFEFEISNLPPIGAQQKIQEIG
jgi:hypothetical protein